jgi:hypothetical protein
MLIIAWGLVRLDGLTYWFTVVILGIVVVAVVATFVLAALGLSEEWPMAKAGFVGWCALLLLLATFVLLVVKASVRAPWSGVPPIRWTVKGLGQLTATYLLSN